MMLASKVIFEFQIAAHEAGMMSIRTYDAGVKSQAFIIGRQIPENHAGLSKPGGFAEIPVIYVIF